MNDKYKRRSFLKGALSGLAAAYIMPSTCFGKTRQTRRTNFLFDGMSEPFYLRQFSVPSEILAANIDSKFTAVNACVIDCGMDFKEAVRQIAIYRRIAAHYIDNVMIIENYDDFRIAKKRGRLGLVLAAQDVTMLDELSDIDLFYGLGLRVMQLTYNQKNRLGSGCLDGANGGLSSLGIEAIERMNEIGITIDCSHATKRTTAEIISNSKKPVIISHTGCNTVFKNPRNNDDDELRAVADKGGVVGIYFMSFFLSAGPGDAKAEDFYNHLVHAINICGVEHVGIGTDHPIYPYPLDAKAKKGWGDSIRKKIAEGVAVEGNDPNRWAMIPELHRIDRFDLIADNLYHHGFSSSDIEKVMGTNFRRVFAKTWTPPELLQKARNLRL